MGQWLAGGGEAWVYRLSKPAGFVLKEYKTEVLSKRGSDLDAKLRAMLQNPPRDRTREQAGGHVSIAWPERIGLDRAGALSGYVMPAIDKSTTAELHHVQNPSDRLRKDKTLRDKLPPWLTGFTWRYLVRVAANLSSAVEAIHEAGYVIGDFNGRNVLVSQSALVTILDCDSFQVTGSNEQIFLCTVQLPGTHPPELTRVDLSTTVREPAGDLHLLAVHIYGLLMQGRHPYQGTWAGKGAKPSAADLKEQGIFHYADRRLNPPLGIPKFDIFPSELRALFVRAFKDGAGDPAIRPSAAEWHSALLALENTLTDCRKTKAHVYPSHVRTCPWCALAASTSTATHQLLQRPLPPPVATTTAASVRAPWTPPTANPGLAVGYGTQTRAAGGAAPPPQPLAGQGIRPGGGAAPRRNVLARHPLLISVAVVGVIAAIAAANSGGPQSSTPNGLSSSTSLEAAARTRHLIAVTTAGEIGWIAGHGGHLLSWDAESSQFVVTGAAHAEPGTVYAASYWAGRYARRNTGHPRPRHVASRPTSGASSSSPSKPSSSGSPGPSTGSSSGASAPHPGQSSERSRPASTPPGGLQGSAEPAHHTSGSPSGGLEGSPETHHPSEGGGLSGSGG